MTVKFRRVFQLKHVALPRVAHARQIDQKINIIISENKNRLFIISKAVHQQFFPERIKKQSPCAGAFEFVLLKKGKADGGGKRRPVFIAEVNRVGALNFQNRLGFGRRRLGRGENEEPRTKNQEPESETWFLVLGSWVQIRPKHCCR